MDLDWDLRFLSVSTSDILINTFVSTSMQSSLDSFYYSLSWPWSTTVTVTLGASLAATQHSGTRTNPRSISPETTLKIDEN